MRSDRTKEHAQEGLQRRLRVFVLMLFLSGECGVDAEKSLTTALADPMGFCEDGEKVDD